MEGLVTTHAKMRPTRKVRRQWGTCRGKQEENEIQPETTPEAEINVTDQTDWAETWRQVHNDATQSLARLIIRDDDEWVIEKQISEQRPGWTQENPGKRN